MQTQLLSKEGMKQLRGEDGEMYHSSNRQKCHDSSTTEKIPKETDKYVMD